MVEENMATKTEENQVVRNALLHAGIKPVSIKHGRYGDIYVKVRVRIGTRLFPYTHANWKKSAVYPMRAYSIIKDLVPTVGKIEVIA